MSEKKVALIFGGTGQDASYLFELLLSKGYEVHGTIRRSSVITTERIDHIFEKIHLHYCDLIDANNITKIISKVRPNEIYNTAAQSHVKISAELENYTFQVNTIGILNILQAVKMLNLENHCKIYHCGTSEQFGNVTDGSILLNEESPQIPVSIYGVSKVAANQICNLYRDAYGMFVVCSILFNHEGPRRGHNFVTQKIANYVGKYYHNKNKGPLQLGNLNSLRDWGNAEDYMEAVYLMMQQEKPDNYIISTGETHSVREFVELSFSQIGIIVEWQGEGVDEIGINKDTGDILVKVNPKYFRDLELHALIGDSTKAQKVLGWKPKTTFRQLVKNMIQSAISRHNVI